MRFATTCVFFIHTRNLSRDENTRMWRDVYRLISLLTEPEPVHWRLFIACRWISPTRPLRIIWIIRVNSTVDIWTWIWLRWIYTVHWCAHCRFRWAPFIPSTLGLVYINLQPEYELPSWTRFGRIQKFRTISVGPTVFQAIPIFLSGGLSSSASDSTFRAPLTLDI